MLYPHKHLAYLVDLVWIFGFFQNGSLVLTNKPSYFVLEHPFSGDAAELRHVPLVHRGNRRVVSR